MRNKPGRLLTVAARIPVLDAVAERLAEREFHDEKVRVARLLDVVDRGDVDVVELRENLCLAAEARQALGVLRESFRQDFQRDFALELVVKRAIDLTHAAGAEVGKDLVVI
jgi:hypothetical protein